MQDSHAWDVEGVWGGEGEGWKYLGGLGENDFGF
jgi:hypothetical protein